MFIIHDYITSPSGEQEPTSSPLPAPPVPSPGITLPLYRLPAASTEDNTVPSDPLGAIINSSLTTQITSNINIRRCPFCCPRAVIDKSPAVPLTGNISTRRFRLLITFPLYGLPAASTSAGDGDDFAPSVVPEPSSIVVPLRGRCSRFISGCRGIITINSIISRWQRFLHSSRHRCRCHFTD